MESVTEEEREVADNLRRLCVKVKGINKYKELDTRETTPLLHRLGKIYRNKSPDKFSLIRSAGLFNAALIRQPENIEIKNDLEELCTHVLQLSNAAVNDVSLIDIALKAGNLIRNMREDTSNALNSFTNIPDVKESDGKLKKLEEERINNIRSLQDKISAQYTEAMTYISQECISILGKVPCKFVHAGMGSLAKKEITPFSDFESIILLEDCVKNNSKECEEALEYFRWYSLIFLIVLVNLKETLLRFLAIPSLNNDSERGMDWYYDEFTPCGISPDGLSAHACKNPLGRQEITKAKPFTTELIKPVSDMVKYLGSEEELKAGYYLWDLLTRTCFVSGDRDVYKDFSLQINACFERKQEAIDALVIKQLRDNIEEFEATQSFYRVASTNTFDVKRIVYRGTTIFVAGIGRMYSLDQCSCFDVIDQLKEQQLLTPNTAHRLLYAVSLACQIRLKVYGSSSSQSDMVGSDTFYEFRESQAISEVLQVVGAKSLSDYFLTAIKLQQGIKSWLDQLAVKAPSSSKYNLIKKLDKDLDCRTYSSFYFLTLYHLGLHEQVLNEWDNYHNHVVENNPVTLSEELGMRSVVGNVYFIKKSYREALQHFHSILQHKPGPPSVSAHFVIRLGRCYLELGCFNDAILAFDNAQQITRDHDDSIVNKKERLGELHYYVGMCHEGLGQYRQALSSFRDRLKCPLHILYRANCLKNIGVLHHRLELPDKAIQYLRQALDISLEKGSVTFICKCLNGLGMCYYQKKKYFKALELFERELQLRMRFVPMTKHDIDRDTRKVKLLIQECERLL